MQLQLSTFLLAWLAIHLDVVPSQVKSTVYSVQLFIIFVLVQ